MILVDSSVWIDHFRSGNAELTRLLEAGEVAMHPMVLGELACGQLAKRGQTLHLLGALPKVELARDEDVFHALESRRWFGSGIGWVDAHLLTASLLSRTPLYTLDARLARVARAAHRAHD